MNPFGLLAAVFVWLAFFALLAAFFTRMKPYAHKVRVAFYILAPAALFFFVLYGVMRNFV